MTAKNSAMRNAKPSGGIEAVRLIPAADLESVAIDAGRCTGYTLRLNAAETIPWPVIEQVSSYREETLSPEGVPLVRHTLTLVCPPEETAELFDARTAARFASEGVVARIAASSGEVLLAGWSEKFGGEHPLLLREARLESGEKMSRRPTLTLTFVSEDTAPALRCEG